MTFVPLPAGPFDVVLADPPWHYPGQQDKWGAAGKFYDTLTIAQMVELNPVSVMSKKSIMFMWTTSPKMAESIELIKLWGLHYRSVAFVWVKTKKDGITPVGAQGVRPSIVKPTVEYVLAASTVARGRPLPLSDESVVNTVFTEDGEDIVLAPKQEHSRKPTEVHERISRMYPDAAKLELFARRPYEGWTVWGNEVDCAEE